MFFWVFLQFLNTVDTSYLQDQSCVRGGINQQGRKINIIVLPFWGVEQ